MSNLLVRTSGFLGAGLIGFVVAVAPLDAQQANATVTNRLDRPTRGSVSVTLDKDLAPGPESGRVFVLLTDHFEVEPRLVTSFTGAYYFDYLRFDYVLFFGQDVSRLNPGATITLSGHEMGFPFADLAKLPPGEYSIQAVFNRYEQVTPGQRKAIWLLMDNWWPGAQFHGDADNYYSDVKRIKVQQGKGFELSLTLTKRIPPVEQPKDTAFLKFRKFRSELASKFWGRDIPVGINVLLPKGYDEHPNSHYPVVFHMGHMLEFTPFHFPAKEPPQTEGAAPEQSARWLWEHWQDPDTPRVIVVTLLHPTPYYDDSYFVNSANTGPWQEVLIKELLPYIKREFRTIDQPWARVMTGGSTGGWISLYTQVTRPQDFGGAWVIAPIWLIIVRWFNRHVQGGELFHPRWLQVAQAGASVFTNRIRQMGGLRAAVRAIVSALGTHSRGGEWIDAYAAMFGPVGPDGYPVPLIDWKTGAIDHHVAQRWRDNGFDLRYFMETHWKTLGPKVKGQLFFLCGDMDQFYTNNALYLLEDFLQKTHDPEYGGSFRYGRPMIGHTFSGIGLDPWPFALLREMAAHMREHQPQGFDNSQWNYQ